MSPQNSLPPAGVPNSGNTKYALLAIVMLVGAGGLYAWRVASNRPAPAPPPPIVAAPSAPASDNPKLDDIPAPPPAPEPPPKTNVRYVTVSPQAGCEGKCRGTASVELEQALQVRGAQARRCYNQALSQDPTLKGHVTLDVRIGPYGNLCSSSVASNDMGSAVVANCAAMMFRAAQGFPSPRGGCVDAKVPLSFVPQSQSQGQ